MAGATGSYKRILQVLDKWPADKTKSGRDLGQFLKDSVNKAYKNNEFEADVKFWDKQYISIQKLVNNDIKNKYPRITASSATGLTAEQCNVALSSEFLEELQREEQGLLKKLFYKK